MAVRWSCWLAAELAAVALFAGCAGLGGDDPSHAVQVERRPPVVVVVFDEFPADSILGPDGRIDAVRYPNFAKLASLSTWFPNGYTVYDSTFKAVPSILDGRLPRRRTAADIRSHKPNVFHMMDGLGYDVFKVESASALCPPDICPDKRTRRPGVLARLAGGGRPARFHRWVGAIRRRDNPGFYFHHALMPHEPWLYLPSGRQSRPAGNDPIPGINQELSFDDPDLSLHNHLRYLLQVGYTDRLVGELLRRLERTGLLERSLLVVTADHGYSFQVGTNSRRLVRKDNVEEIAPVPFFIKAPGQLDGRVDRSLVRNIDIVATIADLLGTSVGWRQNGYSAYSRITRERRVVSLQTRDFMHTISIELPELEARRQRWRRHWAKVFGTGAESKVLYGDPWTRAYRIGPNPELLDRPVARLRVDAAQAGTSASVSASVAHESLFADVRPDGQFFPTRVTGPLRGLPPDEHLELALAVNGRIRAVGRSFDLRRAAREFFSLVVPERAIRRGRNRLELFEVRPGNRLVSIYRTL